jgi:hypothetical protein
MVRKEKYIGLGLDTDTAPDKRKTDVYWDAENIQIVNNGRSLSITPIKGETKILDFAKLGTNQDRVHIVGFCVFRKYIYVFVATEVTATSDSAIYRIDENNNIVKIAFGFWDIEHTHRIDAVANYESDNIIKLYWVDGIHPLRSLNVANVISTAVDVDSLNNLDSANLYTPTVTIEPGGSLIAGTIQYVYCMYHLNGSQSNLSPASKLVSISNYFKGYDSQEVTGLKTKIVLDSVDTTFDAIKVYSIHYQELNQSPKISLIYDEYIQSQTSITLYDDGNSFIAELSLSELLNINYTPIIPNTLSIKRDRLFLANYEATEFNPDVDCRSFAYPAISLTTTLKEVGGSPVTYTQAQLNSLTRTHDCINPDYDTNKYMYNQNTYYGTSGYNIDTYIISSSPLADGIIPNKSFKQGEIYRIGVKLFNKYGQGSPIKWVADIKIPEASILNVSLGIAIRITTAGITRFQAAGIVSYQMCVVERKPEDRTVLSQGFIVPSVKYMKGSTRLTPYYHPYYVAKDILPSDVTLTDGAGGNIENDYASTYLTYPVDFRVANPSTDQKPVREDGIVFFYSSDTAFETNMPLPDKIRILGSAVTTELAASGNRVLKHYEDNLIKSQTELVGYQTNWPINVLGSGYPYNCVMQQPTIVTNPGKLEVFEYVATKNYTATAKRNDVLTRDLESAEFLRTGETKVIDAGATASNACSINNIVDASGSALPLAYNSVFSNSIVLNIIDTNWHKTTNPYDLFDTFNVRASTSYKRAIPLVELLRTVTNQYGGASYEDKQRNEYLLLGSMTSVSNSWSEQYIGDIWVAPLSINRAEGNDSKNQGVLNIYEYINLPYIENNHNVFARKDLMNDWKGYLPSSTNYNYYRIADNHKLLGAYNQVPNVFKGYSMPFNITNNTKFPVSIIGSNAKNPNEVIDSWLIYEPNNTKLLEGQYGNITKLHNLNGDLVSIQSTGISVIAVEPRIQTTGSDGYQVSLGIGALLYDHRYLTTTTGTNRKFTVVDDGKILYYYDDLNNTINTLQEGKISTIRTIKALLDSYTSGPLVATYHNKLDQIYFHYNGFTLVYDILLQKFTSKHNFIGDNSWVISNAGKLYQLYEDTEDTSLYSLLTGTVKSSKITYLLCPDSTYEKVFHNLEYRLKGTNFTNIQVTSDRNTDNVGTTPDIKTKFDIHRIHLPRVYNTRERWRGIYIIVELQNTGDFALDDMVIMYNIKG